MTAPKSNEGKAAKKIADILNVRGLNNGLLAYHLGMTMTTEVQNELFDLFLHFVKDITERPIPDHFTMDDANLRLLADAIVRAVEKEGHVFN